jgi:hypothetical protein
MNPAGIRRMALLQTGNQEQTDNQMAAALYHWFKPGNGQDITHMIRVNFCPTQPPLRSVAQHNRCSALYFCHGDQYD